MKKSYIIIGFVFAFLAFFSTTSAQIITGLQPGSVDPQVTLLQKILNGIGKTVANSGPGSPGQETDTYGALTASAVKAFQCEQGIACSNSGDVENWGIVGPKTRALLNSLGASIINTFSRVSPGSQLGAVSDFDSSLVSYTTFDDGDTPGKVGNAKTFNGTSDYIDVPASSGLNNVSSGVSVSAWVNFASPNTNTWQIIAGKLDKAGTNNYPYFQYMLGTDNSGTNKARFFVTIGSDVVNYVVGNQPIAAGSWHHLVGTYDKNNLKIYVDGALQGSISKKTNVIFRDTPLRLGAGGAGAEFFKGAMDEVRVYNRGLTAAEVADLYAAGNGGGSGGGTTPVSGQCSTTANQCITGQSTPITATNACTSVAWKCLGSGGGADVTCSAPVAVSPIAGVCSTTVNTCTVGEFSDASDSSTQYKWNCNGTPSGCAASVSCTAPIPVTITGVCGAAAKTYSATAAFPSGAYCTTGTVNATPSNPAPGTSVTWVCNGSTPTTSPTCTATRAAANQSTFTLTVSKAGSTGTGTITSNPSGINCGSTCSKTNIAAGTSIVLTASSLGTNNTVTWGGCTVSSTNANKCTVIVNANATVTAVINAPAPTPGVCGTSQGGTFPSAPTANLCSVGSASAVTSPTSSTFAWNCTGPNGGAIVPCTANKSATVVTGVCGAAAKAYSATATFPSGAYCSAGTAYPNPPANPIGGSSSTWICRGSTSANDSLTCTATRAAITQSVSTLTVNRDGTGSGTVTGNPALTCSGNTCTATASSTTSYTLNASANSGSTFVGWNGGGCSGAGSCTVSVSSNTTVTATFNLNQQVGNDLIASSRKTDWNYAGVTGGIPTNRTICTTLDPKLINSATSTVINNALASSACAGKVVQLGAGTFNVNGGLNIRQPLTLRGMGPSTILNFSSTNGSGWNYDPNFINIENAAATDADADIPSMGGAFSVRAWNGTNGSNGTYSQGATILDLANTTGINVGDTITMWQDDPADNTVPFSPDSPNNITLSAPENYIVSAKNIGDGNSNNISMQGSGQTKRTGQQQRAKVAEIISGTQVRIDAPGIFRPTGTWKSSLNPKVGLQKTIDGVGLENFQFKRTNGGGLVRSLIGFNKATNSWMTGVSVTGTSPSGGGKSTDVGVNLTDSRNVTIRSNWFHDLHGGGVYTTTTYSVSLYQCSGCLVENNIFSNAESPIEVNSGTTGSVISYNYEVPSSGFEAGIQAHEEGSAMNLFEGNTAMKFWADTFHGNSTLNTLYRNYFYNDRGIDLMSYHRWYNIIGNVIGTKILKYKSVFSDGTKYDRWDNNGAGGVAFRMGYATPDTRGSSSDCYNPDYSTEKLCADPWVAPSTMIWGNFVAGQSPAAGTWDTSEVTPGEKLFPNGLPPDANSSTHSIPKSLYLSGQPSWWNISAWPAIGPDVTSTTGGTLVSNHVAKIPAQMCYEAAGNVGNFSPSVAACSYLPISVGSTGGTGDTTAPSVTLTAPLAGTVSGAITLSATASDDTGVAGVQFRVDGANSGAEDTVSPYSVSLNTTALTNGTHTITAVARDAAGNQTTSGSVTVTVSNIISNPPSTTFAVGASVQVQGANVNTRSTPSITGAVAGLHNTGDLGTITSTTPGISADGYYWWYVNFASGADGYVAENYLRPASVGSASNKFAVNERVQVLNANVNARNAAGTTGTTVNGTHQIGDLGNILGGGILADALNWWNVNFDTGADGWVAESYLASYTGGGTGDTTAPTVAVTAPAAGTVSGTITLSATASDNVGVVAVQFRVDGVNSGVADTSSPYSVSLNTTTLSNGTHTITAVAGDAVGNQTTSASVSVTVSNTTTGGISTKFPVGSLVFANGNNVNVRTGPGINGTAIGGQHQALDLGIVLPINEGWYSDGFNWWDIDFGTGVDGYVAEPDLTQYSASSVYARLEASNTNIVSGGSSTLTWKSLNATSCTGSGGTFAGAKATSGGSLAVNPNTTTPYSLTCTNQTLGTTTTQSVTVNVSTTRLNPCTAADGSCVETTCANLSSTLSGLNGTGKTVRVTPAGSCSLSGISISGLSLIGAGSDTAGSVITSGGVNMTKNSNYVTRVSGFRFTNSGGNHITMGGSSSARAYVVDNNYFNSNGSTFININANGGVIHHNTFYMPTSTGGGPDVMAIKAGEGWTASTTMGIADTQGPSGGERNIYFEDNTFYNILETAPDGDDGARLTIRNNTYIDSSIVFHSGSPNDTSQDGTRQFEVYSNKFKRVTSNNNLNKWIWVRGGSGVIANNEMDSPNTQDYSGKVSVRLGVGCSVPYPVPHQIGQTSSSPQSPPPQPLLIFGNTGVGATESGWLSVGENGTGGGGSTSCGNPGNYVQNNRDYYLFNKWNWTPLTYPHPLVTNPNQ